MTTALPECDPAVQAGIDAAAAALAEAPEVAVLCHVGPDGDALGSILGAGLALRGLGKRVLLGWGSERLAVPAQYAFLPGTDMIGLPDHAPAISTALVLDCASEDRLERLERTVLSAPVVLNIDHHVSNTRFGTIDVVDPGAPATAELVLRLLDALDAGIDVDVATCLYTGLVTDTGRFGYASVTPRAHQAAARLIALGVRPDIVSQAVYESLPYGYLRTLGIVLSRAQLDDGLVITHMTQQDLQDGGLGLDETETVIDDVRKIREADVACVLKEQTDGRWKVSLRSKGSTDVGRLAQHLGGGGHTLAAGCTLGTDLADNIALIRRTLAEGDWAVAR